MHKTLVLVLCALGLLLVGFAGGMYAGSLLRPRGPVTASVRATAVPEVTPSPTVPPETAAPPSKTTTPTPAVSPATPPRVAGTPAPAGKPGQRHPGGSGPANTPPSADRSRNAAGFEQMRAKMELPRVFRSLGRLEELKAPLTAAQAKAILGIMGPLRTQKTLTSDQAKKALDQLQAQLTQAQKDALEQAARERRNRGGQRPGGEGGPRPGGDGAPRPGGEGRPPGDGGPRSDSENGGTGPGGPAGPWAGRSGNGGGQRPGGGDPAQFAAQMETMNPFSADSDNPMAQRMAERSKAIFDMLEAKAGGR